MNYIYSTRFPGVKVLLSFCILWHWWKHFSTLEEEWRAAYNGNNGNASIQLIKTGIMHRLLCSYFQEGTTRLPHNILHYSEKSILFLCCLSGIKLLCVICPPLFPSYSFFFTFLMFFTDLFFWVLCSWNGDLEMCGCYSNLRRTFIFLCVNVTMH